MEQLNIIGIIALVLLGIGLQHFCNWIARYAYREEGSQTQLPLTFLTISSGVLSMYSFYYGIVFYIDIFNLAQPSFIAVVGVIGLLILGIVFQHFANWFFRIGFKNDPIMIFLAVICIVISIVVTYQPFNLILH